MQDNQNSQIPLRGDRLLSGCRTGRPEPGRAPEYREPIFSREGELLAELCELLVDRKGRVQYGLICCPRRHGAGTKLIPLPWNLFEPAGGRGADAGLQLHLFSGMLARMRGYDPSCWPAMRKIV